MSYNQKLIYFVGEFGVETLGSMNDVQNPGFINTVQLPSTNPGFGIIACMLIIISLTLIHNPRVY